MKLNTLEDVFIDHIRDLYDAEKHLVRALPKMAKAAQSEELAEAIREHLEQTMTHVTRLEEVFEHFGQKARAKPCKAIRGLIAEVQEATQDEGPLKDVAIIAAGQKVEHYEISGYGTAKALAQRLANEEAVALLEETLEEEKTADLKLTEVTESVLESVGEGEEEEEMEEA